MIFALDTQYIYTSLPQGRLFCTVDIVTPFHCRTPSLGMVDKTGDLKAAEEALEELKQKERQRKTKEDVVWRLQNAMAVGDIAAMDAMIKG